ncbi:orotidine 5'-phosphate decarboxylase [Thioalkalivibrio versutus]|uniref:Orotidine 5'-phosphate decarboxylase n=1 Tax=Thioalkalivibrio versutus TaxID=106634 RepID=A0A0G3G1F2_9GAMM|nr:orotidine-5'-phosphate decarboxylase [Thioalkalivibrio versutus]AKJ95040.1 orotidine 5'-phosphate decarboxylase [Thioalkalivibrio versutus]
MNPIPEPATRLIVALDFSEAEAALAFARKLDPARCALKVGFELFVVAGPDLLHRLHGLGFRVFLDLKFHDIPNTVAAACRAAARTGVWLINVHASGGEEMMRAAHAAVRETNDTTALLAVTVLTSSDAGTLREIGVNREPAEQVRLLGELAVRKAGLEGLVCSAQEAAMLRRLLGEEPLLVTPGIRLEDAGGDDQKRVMTPERAISAGASAIVVGRPITRAADPSMAMEAFITRLQKSE